jgi:uncharacterized protein
MALQKSKYSRHFIFAILITISVVLFYGVAIEPHLLDIRHVTIHDPYLSNILKNKIVVHLSDLHIGNIGKREQKLLQMLHDIQPDYIFLTGDYVKWKGDYKEALKFLTKLKAKTGVYAVMGDYDYSNTRQSCLFCHDISDNVFTIKDELHFLRDSAEQVMTENGSFWIAGLERKEQEADMPLRYFSFLKDNQPAIILCHSPMIFDHFDENQYVTILAGDTHGGQIPLPSWIYKIIGYDKNLRYNHGLFVEGMKTMYVSSGIGTSHIPLRLFRRPEIVLLHFTE